MKRDLDMIVVFDDATSEMYYARLVDQESTPTVMAALKQVIEQRGLFCALYTDRASHFVYTPKAGGPPDRRVKTQVERALNQTGIELIAAHSPEARGRCERLFGTWQGRLPQEFRLRGIQSVDQANAFLPDWIATGHNDRFTVKAEQMGTAFVPYPGSDLEKIWTHQEQRTVGNDNTVRYDNRSLQVPQQTFRFSMAGCRVLVCEHLDGALSLHYGPHELGRYHSDGRVLETSSRSGKRSRRKKAAA